MVEQIEDRNSTGDPQRQPRRAISDEFPLKGMVFCSFLAIVGVFLAFAGLVMFWAIVTKRVPALDRKEDVFIGTTLTVGGLFLTVISVKGLKDGIRAFKAPDESIHPDLKETPPRSDA